MNEDPHSLPELPLRAERFSAAQMAVHGRQLAAHHVLSRRAGSDALLDRLADNAAVIARVAATLARAAKAGEALDAAATGLLDHYHLIDEQIRAAQRALLQPCCGELPWLRDPDNGGGRPRAYQLALEIVSHSDGEVDHESLARFIASYQEGAPLTVGELQALPALLQAALIDNLRRIAARLEGGRSQRKLAESWAGRMIATAEARPGDLVLLVADMARAVQPLQAPFVAELARRLQDGGAAPARVLQWVGARLADEGLSVEQQVQLDSEGRAADGISLKRSIAGLRLVAALDWTEFAETLGAVEGALRGDPAGVYCRMDAATRAHYRHAVACLAQRTGHSETEVAAEALALAGSQPAPAEEGLDVRTRHVGHYLVGDGVAALRARLRGQRNAAQHLPARVRPAPLARYLGALGTLTLLLTAALLVHAYRDGAGLALLLALGALAVCGAGELALALTNAMAARLVAPQPLPRMDFGSALPDDAHTLVALSAQLRSHEDVAALGAALETHYLGNRDPNLRFCLLTDFADAPEQTLPGDAALLEAACAAIAALNGRYAPHPPPGWAAPFLLLHRARSWSTSEAAWIGRERKHGQLADLHALLRGGVRTPFAMIEGDTEALAAVRYVVSIDAGTQLPRDGARQMVAAMAHPLNQPMLDDDGRVIAGHALLQPRITAALPVDPASRHARRCARRAQSHAAGPGRQLHQDLFGADLFGADLVSADLCGTDLFGMGLASGQGIYEVDTAARVFARALPAGAVLAHSLATGSALRCGTLGDVELAIPCPSRTSDAVAARHRALRGAWQLAADAHALNLAPLARWQLLDRLRRSLVAPGMLALLVLCWSLLPEPAFWSAAVLSVFFLPAFIGVLVGLADKPGDMLWRQHLDNWARDARDALGQAALHTAFLPHTAWIGLDAIVRAGWRQLVARQRLLEWRPAGLARPSTDMEANWHAMWFAPVLAVGSAVLLSFLHPFALFAAAPLLLLWFLSPVLAWWLSQPRTQRATAMAPGQSLFLTSLARRTWRFFETAVGVETGWLAPAALQEQPGASVVERTTPSDIGFGLLAGLSAWDFGFIGPAELLARTRAAFDSMALLERHRGHFLEAYASGILAPLEPRRISTTGSGTLAAHLLTLAAGLESLADAPIAGARTLDGIRATLQVLDEVREQLQNERQGEHKEAGIARLRAAIAACHAQLTPERCRGTDTLPGLADCLQGAASAAAALLAAVPENADPLVRDWALRLDAQCSAACADLLAQAPWMRAVQEYVLDASLTRIPTLRELAATRREPENETDALAQMVQQGAACARARLEDIAELAARARTFADMDFGLLYRPESGLLASGYDLAEARLDATDCTMLASKACLASLIGIARGQLPAAHWSVLKRPLAMVEGEQLLQSASGALDDYLAPLLVLPSWRDTLLERTHRAIVTVQIAYARRYDIPWGMAHAACNAFDSALEYEVRDFGTPGCGIRRGLADDLVVAPYAAMLALLVAPHAACANLERLAALGCLGTNGFYDAIDYTGMRLRRGQQHAVVRTCLAQHQGMGLLALSALLHDRPMARRFAADPCLRAVLPLLQERLPRSGAFAAADVEVEAAQIAPPQTPQPTRVLRRPGLPQPQVQLLSNGRYHVMLTSDGGGYSAWGDTILTRWRGDPSAGDGGVFCYLRDLDSGALWSSAWQPTLAEPEHYEVMFSEGSAQLRRRDHGIALRTEIAVSPEDDVELRRTRIRNTSERTRRIAVTAYVEVAPAAAAAGTATPPWLRSEILAERQAILCTRGDEGQPWLLARMRLAGTAHAVSFETDRARFIGRGGSRALPAALLAAPVADGPLGGSEGLVADAAMAIQLVVTLAPNEEIGFDLVLGAAATRDAAIELIDKYGAAAQGERAFELAWIGSQALLRQLQATEADAQLYAGLAGSVLYPNRALRADPAILARNSRARSQLWMLALSGELPIVLTHVRSGAGLELARQLIQAHAWWRLNGLSVDLVIWYGDAGGYRQALHTQIMGLVAAHLGAEMVDRPGGIAVRAFDALAPEDRMLVQAAASVVLLDEHGSLAEQLRRAAPALPALPAAPLRPAMPQVPLAESAPAALLFDNGSGGFSADGREYLIRTGPGRHTPVPWPNVLANPHFGSVMSESGQAHTWCARTNTALTPGGADADIDAGGEAYYLRDEDSGVFWSPTPAPAPSGATYLTRHGFGYSVFQHSAHGIRSELVSFVALDAPLKYTVLRLRNEGSAARRISVTGYVAWVLGEGADAAHVVTGRDHGGGGALCARSAWNAGFAGRTAFYQVDADAAFTCDRTEFVGRGRTLAHPAALSRDTLSGTGGAGFDPCAALQVVLELQPGEGRELVFMLGSCAHAEVEDCVARHQGGLAAGAALEQVQAYWQETLGALRVETPDPALDVLANGWMMYQTLACRLWAPRGAVRFGEVLQDAMAAVHTDPGLLRDQLLACAAHQFVEGDAQQWWLPSSNQGLRTRSASDFLWLPLAACRYVQVTGDETVLDARVAYLEGRAPAAGEDAALDLPGQAEEEGDLYAHCVRAIRHGLRVGAHGLPLCGGADPIGCMDGRGETGGDSEGESVWLAFFLIEVLGRFGELAERRADYGFALTCRAAAQALVTKAEEHGWDGAWYRRGYAGDGSALGTADNAACRIDALSQTWAVLCGAADPGRAARALAALDKHLVRRDAGLVQLFDPAGGEDTRAALWAAMAFAHLGQGAHAWALFDMLNPVRRTATPDAVARYRNAPYVTSAGVDYATPHIGRAHMSWYTGSAGWMYRLIVESLLGLERVGARLVLAPLLPEDWPGFRLQYRYRATTYEIEVRGADTQALLVDGHPVEGNTVQLVDDGAPHRVELHVVRCQGAALAADFEAIQSKSMP